MSGPTLGSLAAFATVAALLVLTPGVGTAYLTSTVIQHGRRAGYLSALGMVAGAAMYALGAAMGTSVLLRTFPRALAWIAVGGGAFIIWLGLRALIDAWRRQGEFVAFAELPGLRRFVGSGVFISLGNAPLPLFYLVVVPQYVPKTMAPLPGAMLLSFIHLAMAATWMVTLVTLLGQVVHVLRRPRVRLTMQLLTAAALILLGIKSIDGAL